MKVNRVWRCKLCSTTWEEEVDLPINGFEDLSKMQLYVLYITGGHVCAPNKIGVRECVGVKMISRNGWTDTTP